MKVAIIGCVLVVLISIGCSKKPSPEQLCSSVYDKFVDCVSVLLTKEEGAEVVQEGLVRQKPTFMTQCLQAIKEDPVQSVKRLQGVLQESCKQLFDVP